MAVAVAFHHQPNAAQPLLELLRDRYEMTQRRQVDITQFRDDLTAPMLPLCDLAADHIAIHDHGAGDLAGWAAIQTKAMVCAAIFQAQAKLGQHQDVVADGLVLPR